MGRRPPGGRGPGPAGPQAGCAAAGRSRAVASGDNSKRREGVTVIRGARESGGVPEPGPATGRAVALRKGACGMRHQKREAVFFFRGIQANARFIGNPEITCW